jgi:hypothetical protein
MIRAIIDRPYGRVVFLGDRVYSMPIDRVVMHPELMQLPALSESVQGTLYELISSSPRSLAQADFPSPAPVQSAVKDYLVPAKDGCLIVSKLTPELRFNGRHDGKSIANIKNTYGEIPPQVQSLISSGRLVQVSLAEMRAIGDEHARATQSKKDMEEARRRSGRSVRRRDDVSDGMDDEGSSPTRNAIPIRL